MRLTSLSLSLSLSLPVCVCVSLRRFKNGDTIGCGYDGQSSDFFFTHNGARLPRIPAVLLTPPPRLCLYQYPWYLSLNPKP